MLINFLCPASEKKKLRALRSHTDPKDSLDLWRVIFFALFVLGVLAEEAFSFFFTDHALPYLQQHRPSFVISFPVWSGLLLATSLLGTFLLPVLSFAFGALLAGCARHLWIGALWAGEQRRFLCAASFAVPAFFLLCMLGVHGGAQFRTVLDRSGPACQKSFRQIVLSIVVLTIVSVLFMRFFAVGI